MQWQQDGELARADLDALVHALQQVECDHNSAELQRLGQIDPSINSSGLLQVTNVDMDSFPALPA